MINFNILVPIVAILASAWMLTSILRYRSGRHATDAAAASGTEARHVEILAGENERLRGQVSRLEERLSVLERIATDPAERTAREIEKLR